MSPATRRSDHVARFASETEHAFETRFARPLTTLAALAAVVPIVVSVGTAIAGGWMPVSDNGWAAMQIKDVFSTSPPILGNFITDPSHSDHIANGPGPVHFWALAPFYRFSGWAPWGLLVGAGAINIASVVGITAIARRRGGPMLALWSMTFVAVMLWALRGQFLRDIWNPHLAILPLAVLIFASWSASSGAVRTLPIVVLASSFVAQAHVANLGLGLALGIWAIAGLGLTLRADHRMLTTEAWRLRRRAAIRWGLISVGIGALCWTLPLYDQVAGYGNLSRLANAHSLFPKVGVITGIQRFVNTLGIPPMWSQRVDYDLFGTVFKGAGPPQWATATCSLAALATLFVVMFRRGMRTEIRLLTTCLVSLAAGIWTTSQAPVANLELHAYRWEWPVGMFLWFTISWTSFQAVRPRLSVRVYDQFGRAAAAIVVVLVLLGIRQPHITWDHDSRIYPIVAFLSERTLERLPDDGPYLVLVTGEAFWQVGDGTKAELERHGVDIRVRDSRLPPEYGRSRTFDGTNAEAMIVVAGGPDILSQGTPDQLVAYWEGDIPGRRGEPGAGFAVFLLPLPTL